MARRSAPSAGSRHVRPWLALGALLVGAGLSGGLAVRSWLGSPPTFLAVPVEGADPAPSLRAGQELCLISWNIQFSAGRRLHFFYDGGPDVLVPEADVRTTLDALAARIQREAPDLLLLQEIDRGSRRTHRIDELPPLVQAAGARHWASTWYHRARFVPHPLPTMLGRVDMHMAIASRVSMHGGERIQLPLLQESRLRQAFNLRRALLWVELPVEGWANPLHVAVTHLSAFSHGDGTLDRQVAALTLWMAERDTAGVPWILAGDLNLLPPGDDPTRLPDGIATYADDPNPMERLVPRFRTAVPPGSLLDPAQRTYLPFGAPEPDRKIDWIFMSPGIDVIEAGPLQDPEGLSDHLPLRARLRLAPENTF